MDDDDEQVLRCDALRESENRRKAEHIAGLMPPFVWGEDTKCATCENITGLYKQNRDGACVPICGSCLLKEMDEHAR